MHIYSEQSSISQESIFSSCSSIPIYFDSVFYHLIVENFIKIDTFSLFVWYIDDSLCCDIELSLIIKISCHCFLYIRRDRSNIVSQSFCNFHSISESSVVYPLCRCFLLIYSYRKTNQSLFSFIQYKIHIQFRMCSILQSLSDSICCFLIFWITHFFFFFLRCFCYHWKHFDETSDSSNQSSEKKQSSNRCFCLFAVVTDCRAYSYDEQQYQTFAPSTTISKIWNLSKKLFHCVVCWPYKKDTCILYKCLWIAIDYSDFSSSFSASSSSLAMLILGSFSASASMIEKQLGRTTFSGTVTARWSFSFASFKTSTDSL